VSGCGCGARTVEECMFRRGSVTEPEPGCIAAIAIVTAAEFGTVDEAGAGAIVGSADGPLIPEGGNVMVYGDGGVGKTTLCIDLGYFLAAGDDWLALTIPSRRRVLLVECEGPRPQFRRKIRRKDEGWPGSPVEDRVLVFEEPWARFTFADPELRHSLADRIAQHEIDVAIIGPITGAGMDGPGTIQECRAFVALVDEVRVLSGRPQLAIVLIHHENRTGKVSGAWEGVVDTLLHITGQGHGKLRLYIQKAKWASDLHATGLQLAWATGDSFTVEQTQKLDREAIAELILDAVRADAGIGWTKVEKQTRGVSDADRRNVRDRLLQEGTIVNVARARTAGRSRSTIARRSVLPASTLPTTPRSRICGAPPP
jgi:AAA domain